MEEKRELIMNRYQYGLLLNALIEYRNNLIKEGKSTEAVNEVILKLIDAPEKKSFLRREREKAGYER